MRFAIVLILFSNFIFAQNEVIYMWSGGVSSNSIRVNAKLTSNSTTVRLVADDDSGFSSPQFSNFYSVDSTTNRVVSMQLQTLLPNTKYFYCVESGGVMDSSADDVGHFKTAAAGAFSFSIVAGSCCNNSDHKVYHKMDSLNPFMYINMGDLHYANPNNDSVLSAHWAPYETWVLSKPRAANFFKHAPIAYIWDDHDYCYNDADSTASGKENARLAYNHYVPHYPLAFGGGPNSNIAQAFTIGRVHFILTDLRSDKYNGSNLGSVQKQWFKNQCIYARNNNFLIAWVNSYTWNGTVNDNWGGSQGERTELANFFRDSLIANLFILSGDAHMLAIDDGTHADFCTQVSNPFLYPIFQAAAINQNGSIKGGLFSEGNPIANPGIFSGQFGQITFTDTGGANICVTFDGYQVDSGGQNLTQVLNFNFCRFLGTTSVNTNLQKQIDAKLYPNPSANFTIEFNTQVNLQQLRIITPDGKIVFTENKNNFTQTYTPKLPSFAKQIYIVEITTDKGTAKKYWVKE
jgi:hypothetical protein